MRPLLMSVMTRCSVPARHSQRRFGGSLHKNKYLEEWNGMREVSEKTFKFNTYNTTQSILYLILPFTLVYLVSKKQQITTDRARGFSENPDRYM